ncbi:OLC1v1037356C1 [Oldenlandia corymbosa var. corymbosa]|uniref:RING-type E3 ubiquitin transferase n=1 Tax=Oldenlandia corymbosa var. corymbosa TaxID=529605 RepID=A0AAV1CYN8_OLDCO|nr:OLC1v1037356C1 [Oldenlandia corymbosa var. corymbosa]
MSTANPPAPGEILQQASAFLSEVLSQSDLRHRLFSTFLLKLPSSDETTLKPLKLASETLENALTTTNPSIKSSSLRLAEKLLLSYPKTAFSSFLLSLIYSLFNRPIQAAVNLFDVFQTIPSLARLEIAPVLFEELFLIHFLPVLEWYNEQRTSILANVTQRLASSGYDSDDQSVVVSPTRLLNNMNGNQAEELKDLERDYENILDENCKVFAAYFRESLQVKDGNQNIDVPALVLQRKESDRVEYCGLQKMKTHYSIKNRRYNPIWVEDDQPVEINNSNGDKNLSKFPSFVPERVSPQVLTKRGSSKKSKSSLNYNLDSELESFSNEYLSNCYLSDSEAEQEENLEHFASFTSRQSRTMVQQQPDFTESSSFPDLPMEDIDNLPDASKLTPPKDFVCPITTHIFVDPVTLETGQTYERKAIQEWIDRGNSTCPITRQTLQSTTLPKTNYVLKRLIASWLELNPGANPKQSEIPQIENHPKLSPVRRASSPNCVISQASMEGKVSQLRIAITNLCTSEVLENSEMAVLEIERIWQEAHMVDVDLQNMMSKPAVISGFMEVLFNSVDPQVLSATVFLLAELGLRDHSVIQTLTRVDSDVQCIASLFRRGLLEAVVLVYLLRPSAISLVEMDIVDSLLTVLKTREEDLLRMCVKPKTASLFLLDQLLKSGEDIQASEFARVLVSENAIESIMESLEAESREEKILAMSILYRCILEDGNCRDRIADQAELRSLLDSMIGANGEEVFEIVQFLSELVKLERRTFNEQILHIIRDEGNFSTMHMLLTHLQVLPPEKSPVVAGLLLQLDLLVEPRKMSIFREEAIDTLIACLQNVDCPSSQVAAAEIIVSLQGRFSDTGEPLVRALLIRRTGLYRSKSRIKRDHRASMSDETQENKEEEKSAEEWEWRMACALVSHEFGLIFEALADGLRSRSAELYSACFVAATWLVYMLTILPDTGVQGAARGCLLKLFVSIFKSAKDNEDKALSMLALSSFCSDSEGLHDMAGYMKDILKGLRELKKSSPYAVKMLKLLSEENESSVDMWNHKEIIHGDCSANGEVLSIVCFKEKIYSGHSDGTLKVWIIKNGSLHLIQEAQEHTKAVTSLTILNSVERLYSGSLDRTVRVWSIHGKVMHCEQVYEMKDHINNLVISNSISCFIPQGAGIKVHSWSGASKLLNQQKYVKCLSLVHGKLYCGCLDSSIQEVDLATGTISTIQSGSRKLLSKSNPIHALQASDGLLYSASSPLDGATVKIWRTSDYSMVGSLPSTSEVRSMALSTDLLYLGCKGGLVEVWCKKKHSKVEALHAGTNSKVLCMALTSNEDVLFIGTSDGKIQAWELS